jgi:lipoyl-dependent peroxiredoxin
LRVAAVHARPDIGPFSASERPLFIATTAYNRSFAAGQHLGKRALKVRIRTRQKASREIRPSFNSYPNWSHMMAEKTAVVHWEGQGKKGLGKISTETGALKHYPYGFASRFGDDRRGTNPEEILGAAHAACFTMAFSFACDKAGLATTYIDTEASVRLSKQGEVFVIDRIALTMQATVPGIDDARFQEIAAAAKRDCPLSKALASVPEITLQATLR